MKFSDDDNGRSVIESDGLIPEGWEYASLGDVADLVSGAGFPLDQQGKNGLEFPFFKVGNLGDVQSGEMLTTTPHTVDGTILQHLRARIIPAGATVFAKIGMAIRLGRRRQVGVPCCIDNNMMAAIPSDAIDRRYLLRFLETVDLMPLTQATTVPSLRKSSLESIRVPLPPLAEQGRIVAAVEALLARVGAARARLDRAPALLRRFRQAVLAHATTGHLTAAWRDSVNPPSASSNEKEIGVLNHWVLPELPDKWCWTTLRDVSEYQGGYAYKSPRFVATETSNQVLRIGNARPGYVDPTVAPVFITDEDAAETARFELRPGDLIMSMTGTKYKRDYGFVGLVPLSPRRFFLNQRVARLRAENDRILPHYLFFWLQTETYRDCLFKDETGNVNQGNVGATPFKCGPVGLPPLSEQREIVRRVEALFALADAAERRLAAARTRADRLTQSILAQAFRGQLVPTEAELARHENRPYEPASALLARIRAERENSQPTKTTKRRQ
jgi:type I restriction enzyme S subunit